MHFLYSVCYEFIISGPDSSVGIVTGYGLDGLDVQTGTGAHPASCAMGTGSFLGQSGRGMTLTTHPLLAPRLRMSRATPLLPL
jgi:hypothetical protein